MYEFRKIELRFWSPSKAYFSGWRAYGKIELQLIIVELRQSPYGFPA